MILANWAAEVDFNQRVMYEMFREFDELEYYDKQLLEKMIETLGHKKRINNIYYLSFYHGLMHKLNTEPTSPLFKALDEAIDQLKSKHYNLDRAWRYDWAALRMRSWQDLVDRREECKKGDSL